MSTFVPNRDPKGKYSEKTNSESDLDLGDDSARTLHEQREALIESVDDIIDDSITDFIRTAREQESMEIHSVGFDRDGMTKDLTVAINDLEEDALSRCTNSKGGIRLSSVIEEGSEYGNVTEFMNAHYTDPDELADDWQRKNFRENGTAVNTDAWFERNIALTSTGTNIDDIDNWDVEGAAKATDQYLIEVARAGELSLDTDITEVLNESFWTDLSERFCR